MDKPKTLQLSDAARSDETKETLNSCTNQKYDFSNFLNKFQEQADDEPGRKQMQLLENQFKDDNDDDDIVFENPSLSR